MPLLKLQLDIETMECLIDRAAQELRPIAWQAHILLREALGLPFSGASGLAAKRNNNPKEDGPA